MTGWPSSAASGSLRVRATASKPPPGGCGTTTRTTRLGNVCAAAAVTQAASAVARIKRMVTSASLFPAYEHVVLWARRVEHLDPAEPCLRHHATRGLLAPHR